MAFVDSLGNVIDPSHAFGAFLGDKAFDNDRLRAVLQARETRRRSFPLAVTASYRSRMTKQSFKGGT